jgi:hypothetical protein
MVNATTPWPWKNSNNSGPIFRGGRWQMAIEGQSAGDVNVMQMGMARGRSLLSMSFDTATNFGGTYFAGAGVQSSFDYLPSAITAGFPPGGNTGGPCIVMDARGIDHYFYHGMSLAWYTSAFLILAHRSTPDGINFWDGPCDIIMPIQTQILSTADAQQDPHIWAGENNAGPVDFFSEVFDDDVAHSGANVIGKIVRHRYAGSLANFLADSPRLESASYNPAVTSGVVQNGNNNPQPLFPAVFPTGNH